MNIPCKFDVLTALLMKIPYFWDMRPLYQSIWCCIP